MTLERIRLLNFQTHRDFKLKFDSHVTTIVGTSDVGKSSIIRALRWAMQNKPSGDAFVREGEDKCTVYLKVDGFKVVRRKGKGTNEYIVGDGNVGDEKYKAFGNDVPEQIAGLCNVGDVNFQQQHDSPFWFALTAGQVSKELNAVVNLEVIDRTLANVAKDLRKARSVVDVGRDRKQEAEKQAEDLSWVPDMLSEWRSLEKRDERRGELEGQTEAARGLVRDIREAKRAAAIEVPDLSRLEELRDVVVEKRNEARDVKTLLEGAEAARERLDLTGRTLEKAEHELEERSGGVCPLCGGELK